MNIEKVEFGSIVIDGHAYDEDVVIDRGKVRKRNKKASKKFKEKYGHTPLTPKENIPWNCEVLLVGTGMNGALPIVFEMDRESRKHKVRIKVLRTPQAVKFLNDADLDKVNAVLHITC